MRRIFIAAGHYPERPGAGYDGFYEHDEAVRWIGAMARGRSDAGGRVVVVPEGTLSRKTQFINYRATIDDVAVELHFNSAADAAGNRVGRGCESLYYPGSVGGRVVAEACQEVLERHFQPSRGVREGWFRGDRTRGAYFFLERTKCRSVILEPEFIHRKEEILRAREKCAAELIEMLIEFVASEE